MPLNSFFSYLTHTARDEAWGIFSTTVGAVEVLPGEEYPYRASQHPPTYTQNWALGRILNEFQLVYIAGGRGKFRHENDECELQAGDLITLYPGIKHWYKPAPESGWTEYWVGFDGEIPRHLMTKGFLDISRSVSHPGRKSVFISLFNDILDLAKEEHPGYQQLIGSHVMELIALMRYTEEESAADARTRELVDQVKFVFQENIFNSLDVEELARSLGQNYKTFREEFKNYTGLSPYQYFLQMKINKAKELLSEGIYSVKEVSYKLAFQNPYYFSRLFKKKTGVSPSQWNGLSIPEF